LLPLYHIFFDERIERSLFFLPGYSTRKCASYLNILGLQVSPVEIPAISVAECMLDFNGFLVNNKKKIRLAEPSSIDLDCCGQDL